LLAVTRKQGEVLQDENTELTTEVHDSFLATCNPTGGCQ
jgi:hypothetical protein